MKRHPNETKFFLWSLLGHSILFSFFILQAHFSSPLIVVENTNQQDIISAVVLGDNEKSKILPQEKPVENSVPVPKGDPEKAYVSPTAKQTEALDKNVIALSSPKKVKKIWITQNANDLLEDIKKVKIKHQKKVKQQLKSKFEKIFVEQTEKTMRQQLLKEKIKLVSREARFSQGEINKYKALILQAISEQWVVPTTADKKKSCEMMIHLAPGGKVLEVKITKTSGDVQLDSSARRAVFKAAPLPVPPTAEAFAPFRQFVLKVKPENIL